MRKIVKKKIQYRLSVFIRTMPHAVHVTDGFCNVKLLFRDDALIVAVKKSHIVAKNHVL